MSEEITPASEFTAWRQEQVYTDPTGRLAEAFHAGWERRAPGNEPQPAKIIVVADNLGQQRRYEAHQWQDDEEALDVYRKGELIATYPKGHWSRAFAEGTELDDETAKALAATRDALGFAMSALNGICKLTAGDTPEHQGAADAIGQLFDRGFE